MLEHMILQATLPDDGGEVLTLLNKYSAEGYIILSTTQSPAPARKVILSIILGKPVEQPKQERGGIGMNGGGPRREPHNVTPQLSEEPQASS